jgi:ADP-ribose pyrophosphatase YjhB (NUDIX family)
VVYRQLKVGAGVIVEREGMLLLARRGPDTDAFPGTWNLPAGYCEADEPPSVAAAREAEEETGLLVEVGTLMGAYYFDDDPRGNGLLLVYEAKAVGGELRDCHQYQIPQDITSETVEVSALGFFPAGRLPQPLCGGGHDRAIGEWQERAVDRWQPGVPMRYCPHCRQRLVECLSFDRLRPVCPTCGYVYFRDPKVGVSVLVERKGKVLLIQRAIEPGLGKWSLPSGFMEWDEAPEPAARRECAEETGLIVESLELLDVVHYADDFRGPGINLTYKAQVQGGRLQAGDDAQQALFCAPDELPSPENIAFRNHYLALHRWAGSG